MKNTKHKWVAFRTPWERRTNIQLWSCSRCGDQDSTTSENIKPEEEDCSGKERKDDDD